MLIVMPSECDRRNFLDSNTALRTGNAEPMGYLVFLTLIMISGRHVCLFDAMFGAVDNVK